MRQFGLAIMMYKQDYDERLSGPWIYEDDITNSDYTKLLWFPELVYPYTKNKQIKNCLSSKNYIDWASPSTYDEPGKYNIGYKWNSIWWWPIAFPDAPTSKHGFVHFQADAEVSNPAGTILLLEGSWPETWADFDADYAPVDILNGLPTVQYRHTGGFNATFGDGHAKYRKKQTTKPSEWTVEDD